MKHFAIYLATATFIFTLACNLGFVERASACSPLPFTFFPTTGAPSIAAMVPKPTIALKSVNRGAYKQPPIDTCGYTGYFNFTVTDSHPSAGYRLQQKDNDSGVWHLTGRSQAGPITAYELNFDDSPEKFSERRQFVLRLVPLDADGTALVDKASNEIAIVLEGSLVTAEPTQAGLVVTPDPATTAPVVAPTDDPLPAEMDEAAASGGSGCQVVDQNLPPIWTLSWLALAGLLLWRRRQRQCIRTFALDAEFGQPAGDVAPRLAGR